MSEPRFVPRPWKRADARIPVHIMRRFFNYLNAKCVGIEIAHRGETIHSVTAHFNTSAEASGFYRALEAIYEAPKP